MIRASPTCIKCASLSDRHIKYLFMIHVLLYIFVLIYILKAESYYLCHRAGLNRGVPMGRSTLIMGGSFRQGLNAEVVTLSIRFAVQPSPLYKVMGKKARSQRPIIVSCILIGPNELAPPFRSSSITYAVSQRSFIFSYRWLLMGQVS